MKLIPNAVSSRFGRQLLHFQKASPQVMFVAGVAGVVTAGVLACRSTLELNSVLEDAEKREMLLQSQREHSETNLTEDQDDFYSEKEYARHLTLSKVKTVMSVAKLYTPAIALTVVSIGLLTGSHITLNRRNAGLSAALVATSETFNKYRERVTQELGKEKDDEFRYGSEITTETVKGDDGKNKTVKHVRAVGEPSQYARLFSEGLDDWQPSAELNMIFLRGQQNYLNQQLAARGHVFLNEVYDVLGLERSAAGQMVGWVYGNPEGDNFIDFGLYDEEGNERIRDFVNLKEASVLLDFNVDGVVYDLI